jgi:excisionase family DNA binding protein
MIALITFVVGLVILFKGSFRLGGRTIMQPQSRPIAFYLTDGSFVINPSSSVLDTISMIELIAVGLGILLAALSIYNAPRTDGSGMPQPQRMQAASPTVSQRAPDIMTVAEAAAYMRITERDVMGLIDQGKLGAARIGDSYRIARIAIEDFMSGGA